MKCQEVTRLGVVYLNGEVSASERRLIQLHLAECENCQRELASLAALQRCISQSLKQIAAPVEPPPQTWDRLRTKLPRRNSSLLGRSLAANISTWLHPAWELGSVVAVLALLIIATSLAIRLLPQETLPAKVIGFKLTQGMFNDVLDPAWSPDGKQIVFAARDEQGPYHLYIINSDGSDLFQLTDSMTDDTSPRWSPDGTKIAYLSAMQEEADLMIIHYDRSQQFNLTKHLSEGVVSLAWSLDGANIAYVLGQNGSGDLYVVHDDGSNFPIMRLPSRFAVFGSPVWIPASDCLLYSAFSSDETNLDIYEVNSCKPDSPPVQLTTSPADDHNPRWYPYMKAFLYESGSDIYVMETDTPTNTQLIADGFAAAPSPSGPMIAFQSRRSGRNQLFVYTTEPDGRENLHVLDQPGLVEQPPIWSPDGRRLAFTARPNPDARTDIFIVSLQDFSPWKAEP